jgi:hypothetical protein
MRIRAIENIRNARGGDSRNVDGVQAGGCAEDGLARRVADLTQIREIKL